ncbi:MAG: hypothetical protein NTW14_06490 [bacterium]|nr:hypothetical protein [bacterium]
MTAGKLIKFVVVAALLVTVAAAEAQFRDTSDLSGMKNYLRSGQNTYGLGVKPLGLFDPSRLTFTHSFSSSYMSSGSQGVMQNLFMETIGYRFNAPVTLTLNLGYMNQPYSSYGPDGLFQQSAFIGGAAVDWRPRDNMIFHFEVANYPSSGYYGYSPYGYYIPRYTPIPPAPSDTQSNNEAGSQGK